MLLAIRQPNIRTDRTMPAEVAVCIGQSPPSYEWRSYSSTNLFDLPKNTRNYRKPEIMRQKTITHLNADILLSKLEQAAIGLSREDSPKRPRSPKKSKKKLSFADDHGLPLTTEKIIHELPHEPPSINGSEKIDLLVKKLKLTIPLKKQETENRKAFAFDFQQPMSNYIAFKENLESNKVALENIVCRNRSILGTIKVRNISFEKEVLVRITYDSWRTFTDIQTKHIKNAYEGNLQDTFKFTTNVPKTYNPQYNIEFCICFKSGEEEYWDNNSDKNYKMICINPNLLSPEEFDQNANFLPESRASVPSSIFY
jgi:protein phosphatase 1 regulatory subunit 3A/B/C/D/E